MLWLGSLTLWYFGDEHFATRQAVLDLLALWYFAKRWSEAGAQHRQFHFLLMASYMATTGLFAYRQFASSLFPQAFGLSEWMNLFIANLLFGAELILITLYALLHRRAKADPRKWRDDVDRWFDGFDAPKR